MRRLMHLSLIPILLGSLSGPAAAKVTAQQKCDAGKQTAAAKHALAEAKHTKKPDADKRTAALAKCDTKLEDAFTKLESKTAQDAIAAVEDQCSYYGDVENVKAVNTAVSAAVADQSASTDGVAALASLDNAAVCADAGGTWDADTSTCTLGSSYSCLKGGYCSVAARSIIPWSKSGPNPNTYAGHVPGSGEAVGCGNRDGDAWWHGVTLVVPVLIGHSVPESEREALNLVCAN